MTPRASPLMRAKKSSGGMMRSTTGTSWRRCVSLYFSGLMPYTAVLLRFGSDVDTTVRGAGRRTRPPSRSHWLEGELLAAEDGVDHLVGGGLDDDGPGLRVQEDHRGSGDRGVGGRGGGLLRRLGRGLLLLFLLLLTFAALG